ncbi:hypothetical protein [Candidatus Nitrosocosmicus hydrocola]|uniref:hypothetical protein n=1 Tax=Candidatus Nitrosocosmicus hydrocola TaxID=1826872 RepID=UPI0011E5EBAD|nr:hypothetical protein [Candidatus Nitrosocosmicus hydrocola]
MPFNKYKHVANKTLHSINRSKLELLKFNRFSEISIEKINNETFEIDLFSYLKKIPIHSIVISSEHCMLKSFNGELVWIDEYRTFKNLFQILEKFMDKKKISTYSRNLILNSVSDNAENFRLLISICKGDLYKL